jgi:hypothetical protein
VEYSFFYEGPLQARQTPGCLHCIAAAGFAPPHACAPGCSICEAAKTKVCGAHRGLTAALAEAVTPKSEDGVFSAVRSTIDAALAGVDGPSKVRVKVVGSVGAQDAPPRTLTVEVTLLG